MTPDLPTAITTYLQQHGHLPGRYELMELTGAGEHRCRCALNSYAAANPAAIRVLSKLARPISESDTPAKPLPEALENWKRTDESNGTVQLQSENRNIRNPAELLESAGLDPANYEVQSEINKWEALRRREGQDSEIVELWQVKARLKPRQQANELLQLKADTLAAIAAHAPSYSPITRPPATGSNLLVLSPSDAHLGALTWAPEGGSTGSLSASVERVRASIRDLLARSISQGLSWIVLVVGNDLMHADNPRGTTYAGTPLDVSNRYREVFGAARELMVGEIEWLTQWAPVTVVVQPGNHDTTSAAALGEVLAAWFRNHLEVQVMADPAPRKYFKWGCTLLGFAHGSEEKPASLPQLMALERRQDWADATCREWITGHYHRKGERQFLPLVEEGGVTIRTSPALALTDAWHSQRGFVGRPAAQALVYSDTAGLIAQFHHSAEAMA